LRYAILADVHGNLEALEACLADIVKRQIDKLFFLGDVVGYGSEPNACIELIRDKADIWLAGNHDWAVLEQTDITYFNPVAMVAVRWTMEVITAEHKNLLKRCEVITEIEDMCLTHASPFEPEAWHYIFSLGEAKRSFDHYKTRLCFVGHSHYPVIIWQDSEGRCYPHHKVAIKLQPDNKYIINVGSVGQPRDSNPDSCYAIYDTDQNLVELIRVAYDIAKAQKKIIDAGLPYYLAQRLALGQ
jgi:diadenosine tetraphosphatase ApaH/serine/threonine PP2A family protein phosphatase